MKYLGGKFRIAKQIGAYLNQVIADKRPTEYFEPFCGSCWITQEITNAIPRNASDIHEDLIMLWRGLQDGSFIPPDNITEEQYVIQKNLKPSAMRGFVGFGCSFSGKWFGGMARSKTSNRNYCGEAKRTLLRKIEKLKDVKFGNYSYLYLNPINSIVYCDLPYFGTTGYSGVEKFNYEKFYNWCRMISKNNLVYISEYSMPADFKCVLEIPTKTDMSNKEGKKEDRIERLFTVDNNK